MTGLRVFTICTWDELCLYDLHDDCQDRSLHACCTKSHITVDLWCWYDHQESRIDSYRAYVKQYDMENNILSNIHIDNISQDLDQERPKTKNQDSSEVQPTTILLRGAYIITNVGEVDVSTYGPDPNVLL